MNSVHIKISTKNEDWEEVCQDILKYGEIKIVKELPNVQKVRGCGLYVIEVDDQFQDKIVDYLVLQDKVISWKTYEVIHKFTSFCEIERFGKKTKAKFEIKYDSEIAQHELKVYYQDKNDYYQTIRCAYFYCFKEALQAANHSLLSM